MYLKNMSTRLKIIINCEDCGAERKITKACLTLAKRCKPCQKIFNRNKARNRYRTLKGIPLDKPIEKMIKKKAKKEKKKKVSPVTMATATAVAVIEKEPTPSEPVLTPEEQAKRDEAIKSLFEILGDESTSDDW